MIDHLRHIVFGEDYVVNSHITIHNPSLQEIADYGESKYLSDISGFTMRPYDAMVALDDSGIDYQDITDYQLFTSMSHKIIHKNSILTPTLDVASMKLGEHPETGRPILYSDDGAIIDELLYKQIVDYIRAINYIKEKVEFNVGNKRAKQELLRKTRRQAQKAKHKPFESQFSPIISSLVNSSNTTISYTSASTLHVSQMWDAFYRVNKIQNYCDVMVGVYTGNIDAKKLDKDALNWFGTIDVNATEKYDPDKALAPT